MGSRSGQALIVFAHPAHTSFNGAMLREGTAALAEAGFEVTVSDLYSMRFDPVSDRRNFTGTRNPDQYRQQDEEAHASAHDGFTPDLRSEMEKVGRCDLLIFQFPLWWLGLPAILKGWVDRVFAVGRAYGGGRYFETGLYAGKRAFCALTVGGPQSNYGNNGMYAPIETVLYPVHHGVLRFTGFEVLDPFVVYGPARISASERRSYLDRYRSRLLSLGSLAV